MERRQIVDVAPSSDNAPNSRTVPSTSNLERYPLFEGAVVNTPEGGRAYLGLLIPESCDVQVFVCDGRGRVSAILSTEIEVNQVERMSIDERRDVLRNVLSDVEEERRSDLEDAKDSYHGGGTQESADFNW